MVFIGYSYLIILWKSCLIQIIIWSFRMKIVSDKTKFNGSRCELMVVDMNLWKSTCYCTLCIGIQSTTFCLHVVHDRIIDIMTRLFAAFMATLDFVSFCHLEFAELNFLMLLEIARSCWYSWIVHDRDPINMCTFS